MIKWKCIINNWINCYFNDNNKHEQNVSLETLGRIISHLRENFNLDESKSSVLEAHTVEEFILEKFSAFKFKNGTVEVSNEEEIYLVASLLLFFVCVNSKDMDIKNAMCSRLSPEDQGIILKFSKSLLECSPVTRSDVQAAIIDACGVDMANPGSSSGHTTVAETPPALRSLHGEVRRLQAGLEAERFDRNYLQEELARTNLKIEKLLKDKEQYQLDIVNLKAKISMCCGQEDVNKGAETQTESSTKFTRQLQEMEERLVQTQEQLDDVTYERDTYKAKVAELKQDRDKWLSLSQQESSRANELGEQLEIERGHVQSLRELVVELRQHNRLNGLDGSQLECDDPDASIHSLQHNLSVCSEACANVIEVQLGEERAKIVVLQQQIESLEGQINELNQKSQSDLQTYEKSISEKENEIFNLKHRINEEIEEKNNLKAFLNDEVSKLNNEINELEQTLKDNSDSSRRTIEQKNWEIQTLQEEKLSILQSFSDETSKLNNVIQIMKTEIENEKQTKLNMKESYENQIMKLNEKVLNRNNELVELQNNVCEKSEIIESLHMELRNEKKHLEDLRNKYHGDMDDLNERNRHLEEDLKKKTEHINIIHVRYTELQKDVFEKNELIKSLQLDLRKEKEHVEMLRNKYDHDMNNINEHNRQLEENLKRNTEDMNKLHKHYVELQKGVSEKDNMIESLQNDLRKDKERLVELSNKYHDDMNNINECNRQLEEELKRTTEEMKTLQEHHEQLQKDIVGKNEIIKNLQMDLRKETEFLEELRKKYHDDVANNNERNCKLDEELKKKIDDMNTLQERHVELQKDVSEKSDMIESLQNDLRREKEHLVELKNKYQDDMNNVNECSRQLEGELKRTTEDMKTLQEHHEQLVKDIEGKSEIIKNLQMDLGKESELLEQLRNTYHDDMANNNERSCKLEKELKKKVDDMNTLQERHMELQKYVSEKDDMIESLQNDLRTEKEHLEILKNKYDDDMIKFNDHKRQLEDELKKKTEDMNNLAEHHQILQNNLSKNNEIIESLQMDLRKEKEHFLQLRNKSNDDMTNVNERNMQLEEVLKKKSEEMIVLHEHHVELLNRESQKSDMIESLLSDLRKEKDNSDELTRKYHSDINNANERYIQIEKDLKEKIIIINSLQEQHVQLEKDIFEKTKMVESLNVDLGKEKEHLEVLRNEYNGDMNNVNDCKRELEEELKKKTEDINNLQEYIVKQQKDVFEKSEMIESLQIDLKKEKELVEELKNDLTNVHDRIRALEEELKEKTADGISLQAQVQKDVFEKGEIIKSLQMNLSTEKKHLEELRKKYLDDMTKINERHGQLEENFKKKTEDLNILHENRAEMQNDVLEKSDIIKSLQSELQKEKENLEVLRNKYHNDMTNLADCNRQLEEDRKKKVEDINTLQEHHRKLQKDVLEKNEMIETLQMDLRKEKEHLEETGNKYHDVMNNVNECNRQLQGHHEKLEKDIVEKSEVIKNLYMDLGKEKEFVEELRKKYNVDMADNNERNCKLEEELKKKVDDMSTLQERHVELQKDVSEKGDMIESLQNDLRREKEHLVELKNKYQDDMNNVNECNRQLEGELKRTTEVMKTLEERHIELQKDVSEKGNMMESLQNELRRDKEHLEMFKNKYDDDKIKLNDHNRQLEEELKKKTEDLNNLSEHHQILQNNLSKNNEMIESLQMDLQKKKVLSEEVRNKYDGVVANLNERNRKLEEDLDNKSGAMNTMRQDFEKRFAVILDQVDHFKTTASSLQEQCRSSEATNKQVAELKEDRDKLLSLSQQETARANKLGEQLETERSLVQSLRELIAELRHHNGLDGGELECVIPDASKQSPHHNLSVCNEVCPKAVEIQLEEERLKNDVLQQQVKSLQNQVNQLHQESASGKQSWDEIMSEKENEIIKLKHCINKEIEEKVSLKQFSDDEVSNLKEELNKLEQTLKENSDSSSLIIAQKLEEIQALHEEKQSMLQRFSDETSKLNTIIEKLRLEIEKEKQSKLHIEESYENQITKLNEKVLNRNEENNSLEEEKLQLLAKLNENQIELDSNTVKENEEISSLKKDNINLVHIIEENKTVITNLELLVKHELEQNQKLRDAAVDEKFNLTNRCSVLLDYQTKAEKVLVEREKEIISLQKEVKTLQDTIQTCEEDLKAKDSFISKISKDKDAVISMISKELLEEKDANEKCQKDLEAKNAIICELRKNLTELNNEREALKVLKKENEELIKAIAQRETLAAHEKKLSHKPFSLAEKELHDHHYQLSTQLKKIVQQKNEEIAEMKKQMSKMSATEDRATQIIKVSAKYQAIILKRIAEIKSNTVLKELTNFGNSNNCDNELRRSLNTGSITMEDLENFLETTDRHLKRCSEKQIALQKERDRLTEVNRINESEIINMKKFLTELSVSYQTFSSVKDLYTQKLSRVVSVQRTVRREILSLDGRVTDACMCKLERGYAAVMQDLSECAMNLQRWAERCMARTMSPEKIKQAFMADVERTSLAPTSFQNAGLEGQLEELEKSFEKLLEEVVRAQKGEGAKDAQAVTVMEVRAEYEDKLNRMKSKMKQLYTEQIAVFKEKQREEIAMLERELQKARDKLAESSKAYEDHIRGLTTELWSVGEKFLMKKDEAEWLRRKHVSGSLMSLQYVHSSGLQPTQEEIERPSDTHSLRSLPVNNNSNNTNKREGRGLHMSDEEGEVFDNRWLKELAVTPRREVPGQRLSELQWRNSLCPPHLKSSYPAEMQFAPALDEDDIKCAGATGVAGVKPQRKEVGIIAYKKPGPPTPSKQAGRLSATDSELRESLRVESYPQPPRKTSTPSRIRALFRSSRNDTAEGTPRSRRLSNIFRKKQ